MIETVAVEPAVDYTGFGLNVLRERLEKMLGLVEPVRAAEDIEAIHDIRVASRRLRAAIAIFAPLLAGPQFRRFEREAKTVTRSLGAARDLDVMIDRLRRMEQALPPAEQAGMDRFLREVESQRAKIQREVLDSLDRLESARLAEVLDEIAREPDPEPPDLRPAAILQERAAELLSWEPYIEDPARVSELHAMRIAAKHLRYTMEIFAPLYAAEFESAIGRVKDLQQLLGDIHDADVMVPALAAHARRELKASPKKQAECGAYVSDFDGAQGLLTHCRSLREERIQTYDKFIQAWYRLRMDGFFDKLWVLSRAPLAPRASAESAAPTLGAATPETGGDHATGEWNGRQQGHTAAAPAARNRPAGRRRVRSVRDSGDGADSGPRAEEGGV